MPGYRVPWYRVRIDGDQAAVLGEVTQNEALGQLTTAADFELWDQPSLTTGMSVDIYQVEQEAATITAQFAGVVNHVAGQSSPNHVLATCTGPLAKLRRVASADVDLSTMTDGEAVEYVLTACGVSFAGADIQDAGYVLGAQTPVYWRKDSPGAEVVRALDEVMGMTTMEVGAGRVVRFAYDLAPDVADAYATWTRDSTDDYFLGERNFGDLDAIQNVWLVSGATWTGADGCQYSPWGRAESTHPKLGAGVRVRSRSFSSEIIQDEALAEAVVRRMMRWYNREPDEFRLEAVNDPNVVPGRVLAFEDNVYGINLADPSPYTVTGVDRTGDRMAVRGVGGPAGSEGTVTTGVQRQCNQAGFDFDIPGSFTPPTFSLPPLVTVGAFDPDLDGFPPLEFGLPSFGVGVYTFGVGVGVGRSGMGSDPQAGAPDSCDDCAALTGTAKSDCEAEFCPEGHEGVVVGQLTDWVEDSTTMDTGPAGIRFDSFGAGHYEGVEIEAGRDWRITARIAVLRADIDFGLVVGNDAFDLWAEIAVAASPGFGAGPEAVRLVVGVGDDNDSGPPFAGSGDDVEIVWDYDAGAETMAAAVTIGATTYNLSKSTSGGIAPYDPSFVGLYASAGSGSGDAIEVESVAFRYT